MTDDAKYKVFVTQGLRGFFVVIAWWNTEDGEDNGFWEPWTSSSTSHETRDEAAAEAIDVAAAEELECEYYGPVHYIIDREEA